MQSNPNNAGVMPAMPTAPTSAGTTAARDPHTGMLAYAIHPSMISIIAKTQEAPGTTAEAGGPRTRPYPPSHASAAKKRKGKMARRGAKVEGSGARGVPEAQAGTATAATATATAAAAAAAGGQGARGQPRSHAQAFWELSSPAGAVGPPVRARVWCYYE